MTKTIPQLEAENQRAITLAQRVAIVAFGEGVPDDLNEIEAILQAQPAQRSQKRAEHIEFSGQQKLSALEAENTKLKEQAAERDAQIINLENEAKTLRAERSPETVSEQASRMAVSMVAGFGHRPAAIDATEQSDGDFMAEYQRLLASNPAAAQRFLNENKAKLTALHEAEMRKQQPRS